MAEDQACDNVRTQQQDIPGKLLRQESDPAEHIEKDRAFLQQAERENLSVAVKCPADFRLRDGEAHKVHKIDPQLHKAAAGRPGG